MFGRGKSRLADRILTRISISNEAEPLAGLTSAEPLARRTDQLVLHGAYIGVPAPLRTNAPSAPIRTHRSTGRMRARRRPNSFAMKPITAGPSTEPT